MRILLILFCFGSMLARAQKTILISKDKENHIAKWLYETHANLICKEFYFLKPDSQLYYLQHADGIVIGGGEDIHPKLYQQPENVKLCGKIDPVRDSQEYVLIAYALQNKIPILGICRGLQIMNVQGGGTLYTDIPTAKITNINHSQTGNDSAHWIEANLESNWMRDCDIHRIVVNSTHHQAIQTLSAFYKIAARSEDGIIEAIESMDPNHPFAAAIQWHPERLKNRQSDRLREHFIQKVVNSRK